MRCNAILMQYKCIICTLKSGKSELPEWETYKNILEIGMNFGMLS